MPTSEPVSSFLETEASLLVISVEPSVDCVTSAVEAGLDCGASVAEDPHATRVIKTARSGSVSIRDIFNYPKPLDITERSVSNVLEPRYRPSFSV